MVAGGRLVGSAAYAGGELLKSGVKRTTILANTVVPDFKDLLTPPVASYNFTTANVGMNFFESFENKTVGKLYMPESKPHNKNSIWLNDAHEGPSSSAGVKKDYTKDVNNNNSVYNKDYKVEVEVEPKKFDLGKYKAESIVSHHKANKSTLASQYKPLEDFHNLGPAMEKAINDLSKKPGLENIKELVQQNKAIEYPKGNNTNGYTIGDDRNNVRIVKGKPDADHETQINDYVVITEDNSLVEKSRNYVKRNHHDEIYIEDKATGKRVHITDENGNFFHHGTSKQEAHLPDATKLQQKDYKFMTLEEYYGQTRFNELFGDIVIEPANHPKKTPHVHQRLEEDFLSKR